ncbi:MAG: glycosyltransferase family 4 protein [Prevotellaceae bacterium]|jgi:glycosyltransferase involved in cell wall biosynthesis|nr:glycosyltransferase family 4 protein [Prevotellaceae bacterium]
MKIAIILPSLAQKGPILVAKDIVSYICNKVDGVDVYYFDDIVEVDFACPVHRINFIDKIDFDQYDIIHSHMYRPNKYIWKNRKNIRGKTISTIHCDIRTGLQYDYNFLVSIIFRWVWLLFIRSHDKVVVLTQTMIDDYYEQYVPANKLTYIYNGMSLPATGIIEDSDLQLIVKLREKNFKIIGANAILTKRKGLHHIIENLSCLPEYAFVIVGDGKEKNNLMKLANKLGVANRCYFLGFKKNAVSYLPFYDVYAMPSISEGFGLAVIEATLLKRSCVCSDISTFHEIFSEEEVTFFSLNDAKSLQKAIEEAYKNRVTKGEKAYNRSIRNYTVEIMGERYLNIYKSMLD